jgi:hypothetical protein
MHVNHVGWFSAFLAVSGIWHWVESVTIIRQRKHVKRLQYLLKVTRQKHNRLEEIRITVIHNGPYSNAEWSKDGDDDSER